MFAGLIFAVISGHVSNLICGVKMIAKFAKGPLVNINEFTVYYFYIFYFYLLQILTKHST